MCAWRMGVLTSQQSSSKVNLLGETSCIFCQGSSSMRLQEVGSGWETCCIASGLAPQRYHHLRFGMNCTTNPKLPTDEVVPVSVTLCCLQLTRPFVTLQISNSPCMQVLVKHVIPQKRNGLPQDLPYSPMSLRRALLIARVWPGTRKTGTGCAMTG